jgi:acyl carrier protein
MPDEGQTISVEVTGIVMKIANLSVLAADQDMYDAGLSSLASLTLLLELEDAFGVQLSDDQFIACRNVNDLAAMIERIKA